MMTIIEDNTIDLGKAGIAGRFQHTIFNNTMVTPALQRAELRLYSVSVPLRHRKQKLWDGGLKINLV